MKPKVFVTRPLPAAAVERLLAQCEAAVYPHDASIPPEQLAEACRDVDGLLVAGARVREELLAQAPRLRVVSNVGAGYDHIDVEACTRRRIVVTNTPEAVTEATADCAFALLMAVARRVVEGDRYVREGRWDRWQWELLWGADIHHQTLGLYGFGRIGQAMARRARGFSLRVLYSARRRAPEALERELAAQYVDAETLLRESDFLSLHVPYSSELHHLIGAPQLELMKPTAFLINTARGKVVDEEALFRALQAKKLAGAALDVFEHEPRVPPELLKMSNVVLLPHIGSATAATRLRMALDAVENLLAALAGQRPANVVNPEVLK